MQGESHRPALGWRGEHPPRVPIRNNIQHWLDWRKPGRTASPLGVVKPMGKNSVGVFERPETASKSLRARQ